MPIDPVIQQAIQVATQDLELRLLNRLQSELDKKCDMGDCITADQAYRLVREEMEKQESRTWSKRERIMGVVLFLLTAVPPLINYLILTGKTS